MKYLIYLLSLSVILGLTFSIQMSPKADASNPGTTVLNESFRTNSDQFRVGKRFGRSVDIDGNTAVVGDPADNNSGGTVYVYVFFNSNWIQQAKLTPDDDYHSQSEFGRSVSIEGNVIAVGSSGNGFGTEFRKGAVYLFERSGTSWTQQSKLTASDWGRLDAFGSSVSLCGNSLLIGAPQDDDGGDESGSAYVFRNLGSWIEEQKLVDQNGAEGDEFGVSTACEDDIAVIGAHGDDNSFSNEGSVFVFSRSGSAWSQQARLSDNGASQDDRFGKSVSLSSNTLVVGARNFASVYTLSGTRWTRQTYLVPPNGEQDPRFGQSVAIYENEMIVGAPREDSGVADSGSVYTYKRTGSTWEAGRKISATPRKPFYMFGEAVAIDGNSAIIGSPSFGSIQDFGGEAHVFVKNANWVEQKELKPNDGAENDQFGNNVAISGDIAVVSAEGDERVGGVSNLGSVYVLHKIGSEWYPLKQLWPGSHPSNSNDIRFGNSVDIDGDRIIAGAANLPFGGAAYIYSANVGTTAGPTETLDGDNFGDKFGTSVAISGTTAVVGDPSNVHDSVSSGAAFVYVKIAGSLSWKLEAKLTPNDGQDADFFGHSVAIDGEKIVVGAHKDDDNGTNSGSAYVFTRSNSIWTQQAKLTSSDGAALDEFAYDVAIVGAYIVAGASGDDDDGFNSGSAYVFTGVGPNWTQQAKLKASDAGSLDAFARDVEIDQDLITLSAAADDDNGTNSGSAYVFKRDGTNWHEFRKLLATDGASQDLFGRGVAIDGANVLVGAPNKNIGSFTEGSSSTGDSNLVGQSQGAAYFFDIPDEPFAPGNAKFDFDGDGKSDLSIFRPSDGQWWYLRSSDFGNRGFAFGSSTDELVAADYTGDGKTDIAVWRPSDGNWYVLRSEDNSFYAVTFGTNGDIPAPGDFDGDGKADTAVYRPSDRFWYIQNSSGGTTFQQFGLSEDKPVVADYDGDGQDDIAIFRPSVSEWWQLRSTAGVIGYQFGAAGDKTVQGDYTGDGKADVAIFRPANSNWYVLRSEDSSFYSVPFGAAGDIPVPGDYDGDGKNDTAVFRPSDNFWYVQGTTSGFFQTLFGTTGDEPVPNIYVTP